MKLRIALKIWKVIGTPRERAYNETQLERAATRYDRLKTTKLRNQWWEAFLQGGGVERLAEGFGWDAGQKFRVLMNSPESAWLGDPMMRKKERELRHRGKL